MDKEKRIAELDFVIKKAETEKAYHNGAKVVFSEIGVDLYKDYDGSHGIFAWGIYDYKIKEEPRRIPFDGSDAFNLVGQKFKFKLHQNIFFIAVETDRNGVYFNKTHISWADLEFIYDKWNDTLKEWQPCNKVA